MEKDLREDEIKELEEEIDSAVDRLFVENRKGLGDSLLKGPADLAPSLDADHEFGPAFNLESLSTPIPATPAQKPRPFSFDAPDQLEGTFDLEPMTIPVPAQPAPQAKPLTFDALDRLEGTFGLEPPSMAVPPRPIQKPKLPASNAVDELEGPFDFEVAPVPVQAKPSPQPPPFLKSIDQLEAQLLSLEWEITHEKLEKTRQEVGTLRELLKQRKDIGSVLGFMGSVLAEMIADEENIHPSMIKFLLDAKETVKLLFERESEREFEIYKQLARDGIEARFASLRGAKKPSAERAAESPASYPIQPPSEKIPVEWKRVEEGLSQWNHFFEKAEGFLQRIEQRFSELEKRSQASLAPSGKEILPLMDITVFKAFGRLYGVESQKITKLYKVPPSFAEQWGDRPKVRLKDREVALIDLKKTFPDEPWKPVVTSKLLMIQSEGEWKGVFIEEVLKRVTTSPSDRKENGKPLLGIIHWNYQACPVDVPILDVRKL